MKAEIEVEVEGEGEGGGEGEGNGEGEGSRRRRPLPSPPGMPCAAAVILFHPPSRTEAAGGPTGLARDSPSPRAASGGGEWPDMRRGTN